MEQSETSDNRSYPPTVDISSFNTQSIHENFDDENVIHHEQTTPENLDDDQKLLHHQPTTPQLQSHITRDTTESI